MMIHFTRQIAVGALLFLTVLSPLAEGFVSSARNVVIIGQQRCSDQKMLAGHHQVPLSSSTSLSMWSSKDEITGADRFKSCVPYMLPLLDGEIFGKYIYERVPIPLGFLDSLFIGPLYETYSQVPFLGLFLFLALTLGTRGNTDISREVRFNAQQACLIDIVLVFPELIGSAFEGEQIPRYLTEPCMNFVWYTYMSMVLYSIYSNLVGKKPNQIPWISDYAEIMVGPF